MDDCRARRYSLPYGVAGGRWDLPVLVGSHSRIVRVLVSRLGSRMCVRYSGGGSGAEVSGMTGLSYGVSCAGLSLPPGAELAAVLEGELAVALADDELMDALAGYRRM